MVAKNNLPVVEDDTPAADAGTPASGALPGSTIGANIKVAPGKTGVSVPFTGAMDEADTEKILANMQKFVDDRTGFSLTRGLNAAYATAHGPQALAVYNQQQQNEEKQIQEQLANMGAIRASLAANKGMQQWAAAPAGGAAGQEQAAAPGAPNLATPAVSTGAPGAGGTSNIDFMISKLPASEQGYAKLLASRGRIDDVAKMVQEFEIKGKPSEQKLAEYIQSLPAGDQKNMLLRQNYEKAFGPQTYYNKGQEEKYTMPFAMPPAAQTPPTLPPPSTGGAPAPAPAAGGISSPEGAPVTSPFGVRGLGGTADNHPGIDLGVAKGTPVNSFTPGKVAFAGDAGDGYGNKIVIKNPDGTSTLYAHLSNIGVKVGDDVNKNTPLGLSGDSGKATGPHLHVEIRDQKGTSIDPSGYLKGNKQPVAAATQEPASLGGLSPTSTQGITALAGDYTRSQETFDKSTATPLFTQVNTEKSIPTDVDRALRVLDNTKVGPGTSIKQALLEAKGVFKNLPPNELNDLVQLRTLDQTQKKLVANGIKAAYGAQLSDKEGDRYTASLFKLDDPKQFTRATLELLKANALYNREAAQFIAKHPHNTAQEFEAWKNEGHYDRIMKENAPTAFAIANGGSANAPSAVAAQPVKHTDEAARQWLKDHPNDPDAPAVRKKLGL